MNETKKHPATQLGQAPELTGTENSSEQLPTESFSPASQHGERHVTFRSIRNLKPHPRNARKHSNVQIKAIAKSIDAFGFNAPVLVDGDGNILAGHGRVEAAKLLGMTKVKKLTRGNPTMAAKFAELNSQIEAAE